MCGSTGAQETLQNDEISFYQTQTNAYNTAYSNFTSLSKTLNSQFAPILAKGINQQGFSAGQVENLNAQAEEGVARNYAGAAKALNENMAARGGGENVLSSGEEEQLRGELASEAAKTESNEESQINTANWEQGRENYEGAVQGTEALAQSWNPNATAATANQSGSIANTEANTIAAESDSLLTSVTGALGGIAGNAVKGAFA